MASSTEAETRGTAVSELREQLAVLADLRAAEALLGWDRETMMPARGADARGEVIGDARAARATSASPAPELADLLDARRAGDRRRSGRRGRRDRPRRAPRPRPRRAHPGRADGRDGARHRRCAAGLGGRARRTSDFAAFRPHLERQVALRREVAACFPDVDHPYDALLEAYEPGATTAAVREVFATLRAGLVPLIAQIAERPVPPPLPGPLPFAGQRDARPRDGARHRLRRRRLAARRLDAPVLDEHRPAATSA